LEPYNKSLNEIKPKMKKTLQQFIKEHRLEIDECIIRALGGDPKSHRYKNDEERRLWILNDEGLYNWARSEGVRI